LVGGDIERHRAILPAATQARIAIPARLARFFHRRDAQRETDNSLMLTTVGL
jgi:hypothetical protein